VVPPEAAHGRRKQDQQHDGAHHCPTLSASRARSAPAFA
jgi:hypothetical protein